MSGIKWERDRNAGFDQRQRNRRPTFGDAARAGVRVILSAVLVVLVLLPIVAVVLACAGWGR